MGKDDPESGQLMDRIESETERCMNCGLCESVGNSNALA
jgi:ferredoxin